MMLAMMIKKKEKIKEKKDADDVADEDE